MHPEYDHLLESAGVDPHPAGPRVVELTLGEYEARSILDWLGAAYQLDPNLPAWQFDLLRTLERVLGAPRKEEP